jgi:hypothetical protein
MPSADNEQQFLSWVKRKFKAVTSYSEVDGDKLLFYVGQGQSFQLHLIFNWPTYEGIRGPKAGRMLLGKGKANQFVFFFNLVGCIQCITIMQKIK